LIGGLLAPTARGENEQIQPAQAQSVSPCHLMLQAMDTAYLETTAPLGMCPDMPGDLPPFSFIPKDGFLI